MKLRKVINIDEKKCVNCHACISVCPVKYANDGSGDSVKTIDDLCIGCGECLKACTHEARTGIDDFAEAMKALEKGEPMIAIVAPAIAANFPGVYLNFNGWLKSIGVKAIFDVAFGAELTVSSYLDHVKINSPKCVIAQPCPAIVTYIQIYRPELLPYLAPAHSPMLHTIAMIRKYYPAWEGHKVMVISPCIAKSREFEETGLGDYNVTMASIANHLKDKKINLAQFPETGFDNESAERAVLFSTPGGLLRTAEREHPEIRNLTRKIEGPEIVYKYLDSLPESIRENAQPLLIDCLNCEMGCNGGTGTLTYSKNMDIIEHQIEQRSIKMQEFYREKGLLKNISGSRKTLRKTIGKYWKKGLYERKYKKLSGNLTDRIRTPSPDELKEIYASMHKYTTEDLKNCSSCGYGACEKMASAIFSGLNKPENCHFFLSSSFEKEKTEKDDLIKKLTHESTLIASNIGSTLDHMENLGLQIEDLHVVLKQFLSLNSEIIDGIRQSQEDTEKKKSVVDFLLSITNQGLTTVSNNKKILEQIVNNTDDVGKMVELVDDIIERTNLLSLNAAIEASHAGEFGRGFAVVAHEVKKLVESAQSSTTRIGHTIRESVTNMNMTMRSGNETSHAFEQISGEVRKVADAFVYFMSNMQDLSSKSNELMTAIDHFSKLANEVKKNSEQITGNIREIRSSFDRISS